ncbi:MAG: terminase large subunit domain-containing protein [Candidatus Scalinduaceae bacterium]
MIEIQQIKKIQERCRRDPVFFSENVLGNEKPWSKQVEIMEAVKDHPEVNVCSGHGIGKSWVAARVSLWFLYSFAPSIVVTTAPTWRQVESILWQEIARQYRMSKIPLGGKLTNVKLSLDDGWFAIGLSTDEPENFQGFHSENILIIFDEAGGIEKPIYEATQGLLTGKVARVLRIGNPTSTTTEFYNTSKSDSVKTLHISSWECPNVVEDKIIYPRLVTREWCEKRRQEWGEDSPIYQSRVLGEWPVEGEDTLIPLSWCERAVKNEVQTNEKSVTLISIDCARFGSDQTVIMCLRGSKLLDVDSFQGKDLMETCGRAIAMKKKYGAKSIVVDDTGLGGGLTDRLREQEHHVYAINFGQAAKDKELFADIKSEMFWLLREDIRDLKIQIMDGLLLAQLPTIKYTYTSKGQIKIESKESMRKRGLKSPDHADCLALANYIRRQHYESSWQYEKDNFNLGKDRDIVYDTSLSASELYNQEFGRLGNYNQEFPESEYLEEFI